MNDEEEIFIDIPSDILDNVSRMALNQNCSVDELITRFLRAYIETDKELGDRLLNILRKRGFSNLELIIFIRCAEEEPVSSIASDLKLSESQVDFILDSAYQKFPSLLHK